MVSWIILSLLDDFDTQKIEESKLMRLWWIFVIKREYSKYAICSSFFNMLSAQIQKSFSIFLLNILLKLLEKIAVQIKLFSIQFAVCNTAWKVSKYGVFSGRYLSVFSPNAGKYVSEETPYLDTFHAVWKNTEHLWNVIHLSLVSLDFLLCVKVCKIFSSMQRMIFNETNCCLKIHKFVCSMRRAFLWEIFL